MTGRIDVHSHLLPGVDDGCVSVEQSLACARLMSAIGYTHMFCTPHVVPSMPAQTVENIAAWTADLQTRLNMAQIPIQVLPGGEINLWPTLIDDMTPERLITYALAGRHCLVDIWCDRLPDFFEPTIRWLQDQELTVILAHPERMGAVQADPALADYFAELGLLLQGNLQCLNDPPESPTRSVGEKFLREGRYFMLGSDLHELNTLAPRMAGLQNALEMVGKQEVLKLTKENPSKLLEGLGILEPA